MFQFWKNWKRKKIASVSFPEDWKKILQQFLPFYSDLEKESLERFEKQIQWFVAEKHFIPAGGMEITDEVRVVIAATAVRLTLHSDYSFYDRLTEIVVYPDHYQHPDQKDAIIYGEAHHWGTVVLSWKAVLQGLKNPLDGRDTAIHEFAHVLDRNTGDFNGTPILADEQYHSWAQIMNAHFVRLKEHRKEEKKVLDFYGAQNEAEFFAVATESFFEKSEQMKEHLPDLYEKLKSFYGWDPAQEKQNKRLR